MKASVILLLLAINVAMTAVSDVSPWKDFRGNFQNNVGYAYHRGLFLSRDSDSAVAWYQRAITNGSAKAANNLAELYEANSAYSVSDDGLIQLYRIAAKGNIDTAQNNLGYLLLKNNDREAIDWFERAAQSRDQSVADTAQENLRIARTMFH